MEQIPKEVIKVFAKEGGKIIPADDSFNLYMEWVKWLDYVPTFEQEKINKLIKKKNKTSEEYRKVGNYYYYKKMAELFKEYGTKNMDMEEYEEVLMFMKQNSIEEYMNKKLSKEEIELAKNQIDNYKKIPDEVLFKKVFEDKKEDNYMKLSMIDAYILHYIDKIAQVRFSVDFQNKVKEQNKSSSHRSQRSLIYASKQNKNK
jgi:hypothetical protein